MSGRSARKRLGSEVPEWYESRRLVVSSMNWPGDVDRRDLLERSASDTESGLHMDYGLNKIFY